jgi:renalase
MTDSPSVIIVGAGIAGLMAGTRLNEAGFTVALLDKGRSVGGRMATRRFGGATFDHGAQYFTVRDKAFGNIVDGLLAEEMVHIWANGFPHTDGSTSSGKYPRYRGHDGMTRMAKTLAEALPVQVSTRVTQIDVVENQWELSAQQYGNDDPLTITGDVLLMTPPAEQTLTLMGSGNVILPQPIADALENIQFNPCFAVMALLDRPSQVPVPGGVFMPGEPISWIADNQQKGISDRPAITIHAGPDFTREHYDMDRSEVAKLLLEAAAPFIGDAEVVDFQVQRWRYSQPSKLYPEKTLFTEIPAPVAFAGDAFEGARVEGAALSGLAAAERIIAYLSKTSS